MSSGMPSPSLSFTSGQPPFSRGPGWAGHLSSASGTPSPSASAWAMMTGLRGAGAASLGGSFGCSLGARMVTWAGPQVRESSSDAAHVGLGQPEVAAGGGAVAPVDVGDAEVEVGLGQGQVLGRAVLGPAGAGLLDVGADDLGVAAELAAGGAGHEAGGGEQDQRARAGHGRTSRPSSRGALLLVAMALALACSPSAWALRAKVTADSYWAWPALTLASWR